MTAGVELPAALAARGTHEFPAVLRTELEALPPGTLPLHRAARTGYVDEAGLSVTLISVHDEANVVQARVGVFFREILAGCSCGEDPARENAYCELRVTLDGRTGAARFELVPAE